MNAQAHEAGSQTLSGQTPTGQSAAPRLHITLALKKLVDRNDLGEADMRAAVGEIMRGESTPARTAAFLVALRMKGETAVEIAAAASVMRELAEAVPMPLEDAVLDIVGTGGDGVSSFNVSTAASFVCAAAGVKVAKHGNRSVSSNSGSADVLEAAGAKLDLSPEQISRCISEVNFGFMFAPQHHAAMKHASPIRRELGIRTVFNLLGPLTNPAAARFNVVGVYDRRWLRPMAEVLKMLGSQRALVVHSADGMDELSISAPSFACELNENTLREFTIEPQALGMHAYPMALLKVANAGESLNLVRHVLSGHSAGQAAAATEIVTLNAAAGLYIAGACANLGTGVAKAREILASGAALTCLERYVALTRQA
jgi:anthranilate phosphoribosyltransferase